MTTYDAVMIAEGVTPVETEEEYFKAFQHLIDDGIVWQLQGFFGRTATNLIEAGHCHHAHEKGMNR